LVHATCVGISLEIKDPVMRKKLTRSLSTLNDDQQLEVVKEKIALGITEILNSGEKIDGYTKEELTKLPNEQIPHKTIIKLVN
jgi:hypothetical protein